MKPEEKEEPLQDEGLMDDIGDPLLLTVNQPLGVIVPSPQVRRLIHRSCGGGVRPFLDTGNTRGPRGSLLFPGLASVGRLAGDLHVAIRAVGVIAAALFMWLTALLSHC
ncbi:hypothetical protein EYF80_014929 [Liparis tanakae]|uniref:Uncharacterized protein n=1 Tax=Liparis tanakae TaxID=230148 RepID=A0A4Z2I9R9_9TELE|nr:hypothetical protein EYF80_014929 [Liparis tanakae]